MKIISQPYHDRLFKGSECQKIFKNISSLQQFVENHTVFEAEDIINCLRKFSSVVECCFRNEFGQNYQHKVQEFQNSFLVTRANISPKVHNVFQHVHLFVNRKGNLLRIFSEQATEASFFQFKLCRQLYK